MTELTTLIHDASEIVVGPGDDDTLERYEDAALAVVDGRVAAVGPTDEIVAEHPPENASHAIDADGRSVIPGFVDSHTHGLFAGDRSDEFAAKLRGKEYQEILAEGGGILRTVRAVREASDEQLLSNLLGHLDTMLAHGTTTVEIKSGYGLDTGTELRMLDVIRRADDAHPIDVVPTFMGAHAVPEGSDAEAYTERVLDDQLPAVADQGVAEFCDVFCEEDVFSVAQSRRVLEAGVEHGLTPKVHAEEFVRLGGAQLAADLDAASADHLLHANADDRAALADAGVTPVLLPGTAFSLGADYADARAFLDEGGSVAVATDFNPNCHSQSMGFAIALACVGMEMTPAEALLAGTHGGARALDRAGEADGADGADGVGTLREGMAADVTIVDAPSHVHVPYNFGVNTVETVLKRGEPVSGMEGNHE
ncbi:imidazolonepropionase [Halococcus salifodinae]|uniref:Imidazolonepropionase n=1 Tax=Halococcus salifodinae DSM 8989 TaxID=1227456 RepID=M0N7S7_9EURY|nr:imidazolonepropionase [Halococcus salifodinae]EMA53174.1 imidazolonepropionase [Halococcus salifodinae DSM 8989]